MNGKPDVVIVTGSSGMLGSALIHKIAPHYRLVGFDKDGYPFPPAEAECVCVDLTSDARMAFAFKRIRYAYGNKIASVVHLAAYYDFLGKPSDLYDKVTVKGTERMLKYLQDFEVEQFIFSSSMLVYKPSSPGVPITEESSLEPKWDYPKSKVTTEKVMHELRGKIPVVMMRIAGVYSEEGNSIPITNQAQRIYEKQISARLYPANTAHGSTYVHRDDVINAIVLAIEKRKDLPREVILNIGDNETLTYQELQDIISTEIHGKKMPLIAIPKWFAKAGAFMQNLFGKAFIKPWMIDLADDHFEMDSSRAKNLLDWKPKHGLRYTLPKMLDNLKANPEKFYKDNKLGVSPEKMMADQPQNMEDMGSRGVTRPMMNMESHEHKKVHDHKDMDMGAMKMSAADRTKMLVNHHKQTLWVYWVIVLLGFWMIASPLTFDYGKNVVSPAGGRPVWLSLSDRIAAMYWSDIISGLLLVIFGWRSLKPNRPYSVWIICFIGIWISMAPLLFWAPTAVAYYNGTMVGALIIALSILIPGMPNMILFMKMGGNVPTGWSYNPSSWPQRSIMIGLAFVGWLVSRYLGAFQLGYIDTAWDPFFGEGTLNVLNSNMSHSWPISDAALGTLAYTLEFLMGFMGGTSRWRTMPWMVTFFGFLVIPLGFVSIFLVISQPLTVGAWCTLCLFSALIMLPMIPLQIDEVIAMWQHMVQRKQKGDSLWKVFWKGGDALSTENDQRSPELATFVDQPWKVFKSSIWGMSAPWQLTITAIIGLWLMLSPAVFRMGIETSAANLNHLGGALVIVFAVVAMAEVLRSFRYFNVLLGLALTVMPWFINDANTALTISSSLAGLFIMALSFPKGKIKEKYGLWDKYMV